MEHYLGVLTALAVPKKSNLKTVKRNFETIATPKNVQNSPSGVESIIFKKSETTLYM